MARIVRSRRAETDVAEIWLYIARDNPAAANRLLDKFDERLHILAEQPGLGRPRPECLPGLRSSRVGAYVIFYRPITDGIELYRVFHGARDLPRLFGLESSDEEL